MTETMSAPDVPLTPYPISNCRFPIVSFANNPIGNWQCIGRPMLECARRTHFVICGEEQGQARFMSFGTNGNSLNPPLKWAGGKRWQLPYVKQYWDCENHRRLVEPFCGGLAMALGLMPRRAVLNDINPHLINFYSWLQRGLKISIEMDYDEALFYRHRSRFNEVLRQGKSAKKEAASLFYYLNRTAYNGLCRFNRQGEFNVPFGKYSDVKYRRDFTAYKRAFSQWEFSNTSFDQVALKPDDFVYADPPYDVEFTQYSKEGFGWHDQVQTAEMLARHEGPVVLSNQATRRIMKLYRDLGYRLIKLDAPRRISCTGDRSLAKEVLALRNLDPRSHTK